MSPTELRTASGLALRSHPDTCMQTCHRRREGLVTPCCTKLLGQSVQGLSDRFRPYAVQFAPQMQQAHALAYPWDQPSFGELVAVWHMQSKDNLRGLEPRGILATDGNTAWLGIEDAYVPSCAPCECPLRLVRKEAEAGDLGYPLENAEGPPPLQPPALPHEEHYVI
eukprot:6460844-Amphidinium_carterae.2